MRKRFFDKIPNKLDSLETIFERVIRGNRYVFKSIIDVSVRRMHFWDIITNGEEIVTVTEKIIQIEKMKNIMEKSVKMSDAYVDPRPYGQISFSLLDKLLYILEMNGNPASFLIDNNIRTIAVYGIGVIGKHLYRILNKSGIKVLYAIDRDAMKIKISGLNVYMPEGVLPHVDAVVVTPVKYFYEIEKCIHNCLIETHIISAEVLVDYEINLLKGVYNL